MRNYISNYYITYTQHYNSQLNLLNQLEYKKKHIT